MRIGFCNGCFDLFHEGHFHFLASAAEHCDYLIVALNSDESVARLKGAARPRQVWPERMEGLMETQLVDAVIPSDGYEQGLIVHIRPHVVIRGYDQSADITSGTAQVAHGIGCDIVRISHLEGHSTTLQIQRAASKTNA